MNVEMPDGTIIEGIPEGTSKAEIEAMFNQQSAPTPQAAAPQSDVEQKYSTWLERLSTGMRDPIAGGAQFINNALPGAIGDARQSADAWLNENTGGVLGYPGGDINAAIQQREQDYRAALPPDEGFDEARLAGNLATSVAATRGLPIPKTMGGAVGQGAVVGGAEGAAMPVTGEGEYWDQKGGDIAGGAAMGGGFGAAGQALSRVIAPKGVNRTDINALKKEGIEPTVGQTLGGGWNALEEKATSMPILGTAITEARNRGKEQLNKAMLNRTVRPVGGTVDDIGTLGVAEAQPIISKAYDDAMAIVPGIKIDGKAAKDLLAVRALARNLPDDELKRFNKFYTERFHKRLSPSNGLASETYKKLDSDLNEIITSSKGKEVQGAFKELKSVLRKQAARTSPDFADAINSADEAYARLVRIENASNRALLQDGVFTPGQMVNSIKATEQGVRKKLAAAGKSLDQGFAAQGQRILANRYPDSGTAGRTALMGGGAVGAAFEPMTAATTAVSLLAASQLYRPGAQKAIGSMLNRRPSTHARQIADSIGVNSPALTFPVMEYFANEPLPSNNP